MRGTYKAQILNEAGALEDPAGSIDYSVVNLLPSVMFSKVDVKLNNLSLDKSPNNAYSYKAFFETLLSYNDEAKKSHFATSHWLEDKPATATAFKTTNSSGYNERKAMVAQGKLCYFSSHIHSDIFGLKRCLLPQISIKIDLTKQR